MNIDKVKRTISDVSLIQKGQSLNGGIVDDVTIDNFFQLGKNGIPVYISHVEDVANRNPGDSVGMITGIYKDQENLRGHVQFFKAYAENKKAEYETLMERAEGFPQSFGISMAWFGESEKIDGSEHYRANIVGSADFVSLPAANDKGLLSIDTEKLNKKQDEHFMKLTKETYEKIKEKFPKYLDKAVQLSFASEDKDILPEIEKISKEDEILLIVDENKKLKEKIAELEVIVEASKKPVVVDESEKIKELSLKITAYENKIKKMGISPIDFGSEKGKQLSLTEQMNSLNSFADQLSFYRKNKTEIDKETK